MYISMCTRSMSTDVCYNCSTIILLEVSCTWLIKLGLCSVFVCGVRLGVDGRWSMWDMRVGAASDLHIYSPIPISQG